MEIVLTVVGSVMLCVLMWLGMRASALMEREKCALIAEDFASRHMNTSWGIMAGEIANKIRKQD